MDKKKLQEITLIVNESVIKLANGNTIIAKSYRSTNQGIYVLTNKTASVFGLKDGTTDDVEKLCFIPYEQIEVVLYDVSKEAASEDPQKPQEVQG